MSRKNYQNANIRNRSLSGSGQKYKNKNKYLSAAALKSGKSSQTKKSSAKTKIKAISSEDVAVESVRKTAAPKSVKTIKTDHPAQPPKAPGKSNTETVPKKELLEPAFLTKRSDPAPKKQSAARSYPWKMIIPALAVILCLALFVVASQAGWIQTFLTPESRRFVKETTPEETTTIMRQETTTERVTKETTTKETTTEYIPSYYVINVNLGYNRVTVYSRGEKLNDGADPKDPKDDEYDLTPVIAFTCSPGLDGTTPTGTYYLQDRNDWCLMIHDVYTQYATRIVDDVMFHSIPYLTQDPGDLATYDYNILGYDASSACIRLNVRDASWIFNNCAYETEVNIFYDYTYPGPLDPEPIYQIPDFEPLCHWDPTDVYSAGNPWLTYEAYLSYQSVEVPCYSSPDALIAAFGPTDEYHNNLAGYFHTDGGYDLQTPGTYTTTAHIDVANCNFSFPVTITVTEDYADNSDGYYDEYGDFIYYDNSSDYSDDGTEGGDGDDDFSQYDAGGYYGEDAYFGNEDWYDAW